MKKERKEECETWHAEQVIEGKTWNFQTEMLEYCKSDVKLLKEGCLKFAKDTKRDAVMQLSMSDFPKLYPATL